MKIIDLAICVNNVDPKGIGRIRCVRYNDYIGEKEKSLNYVDWDDNDPFVASPFLPLNINVIAEIGQAVKILNYNTDKETVNQEYISGPFTTMFDFNGQTFSQQIENTTYGVAVKHKPNIRFDSGKYKDERSENSFAKEKDFGVYGKFGSDILFTENGLQLRGGKLLSKEAASVKNRETLIDYPLMSIKSSRLYLKKFPKKMTLVDKKTTKIITESKDLKYIIEYGVDDLSGTTSINFYVYQVIKPYGVVFKTSNFTENSPLLLSSLKLINTDNTTSTPTLTINNVNVEDLHKDINDVINTIHEKGLNGINPLYIIEESHPFFFRPTESLKGIIPNNPTEAVTKTNLLNKIKICRVGPSSGLIWSQHNATQRSKLVNTIVTTYKTKENSPEQTFAAITSDKMYFLSTDDEMVKNIEFNNLDKYEFTQEDYIQKIEPKTFATVRGETLLKTIMTLVDLLLSHEHNLIGPAVKTDPNHEKLRDLMKTLENDLLNKNIRIN